MQRAGPGISLQTGLVLPLPPRLCGAAQPKPRAAHSRRSHRPCVTLAGQQVAVVAPQPPPPPPAEASGLRPTWALGAAAAGLAAAVAVAWSLWWGRSRQQHATLPPPPPPPPAQQDQQQEAPSAVEAAREAVHDAATHLAASSGAGADAAAASVGPLVLAAESGAAVDETATMSLEQLQGMAKELYLLIQQMEVQLQELVYELSGRLSEGSLEALDEATAQIEAVEERLAGLKGVEASEAEAAAAEKEYSDLQWLRFDIVTRGSRDVDRRTYRSLLYNLTTQRQLLRQVEAQEALKLRMREVEQRIAALLGEEPQQAQRARQARRQPPAQAAAAAARAVTPPSAFAARHSAVGPAGAHAVIGRPSQAQAPAVAPAAVAAVIGRPGGAPAGELHLVSAGASLPHPLKAATGGEDAFLLSGWGRGVVAVADGVGGWAAEGVDPSRYPRRLMAACEEAVEAGVAAGPEAHPGAAALAVLEAAHVTTVEPGSCTVVVGLLLPGGRLSVANLGDTSLRIVRRGRIVHASKVLEHTFNMPLQLSSPEYYDCGSTPTDAHLETLEVQEGDVVVLGSDGLFDNLWDDQIVEAVVAEQASGAAGEEALAEALALRLARVAHRQSLDPQFISPFAAELQERAAVDMGMLVPRAGGKPDDATAVVALVSRGKA